MKLTEQYEDNLHYIDKIGRSLLSKFPQDQDEQLWLYIQSALLAGLDLKNFVSSLTATKEPLNGRKTSGEQEEEIDDDEDTALLGEFHISIVVIIGRETELFYPRRTGD